MDHTRWVCSGSGTQWRHDLRFPCFCPLSVCSSSWQPSLQIGLGRCNLACSVFMSLFSFLFIGVWILRKCTQNVSETFTLFKSLICFFFSKMPLIVLSYISDNQIKIHGTLFKWKNIFSTLLNPRWQCKIRIGGYIKGGRFYKGCLSVKGMSITGMSVKRNVHYRGCLL